MAAHQAAGILTVAAAIFLTRNILCRERLILRRNRGGMAKGEKSSVAACVGSGAKRRHILAINHGVAAGGMHVLRQHINQTLCFGHVHHQASTRR